MEWEAVNSLGYTNEQALVWYEDYKDHTTSVSAIADKYKVKSATMVRRFKKLGLQLRSSGFRPGNCRGVDGKDSLRLAYLWLYKFAYKRRAFRKGWEFTISEDQFITLVTSPCHYCGKAHTEETRVVAKKQINMLTVDRVDSKMGYTPDNCVPCCKLCNTMKLDSTVSEFMSKIKNIYERNFLWTPSS